MEPADVWVVTARTKGWSPGWSAEDLLFELVKDQLHGKALAEVSKKRRVSFFPGPSHWLMVFCSILQDVLVGQKCHSVQSPVSGGWICVANVWAWQSWSTSYTHTFNCMTPHVLLVPTGLCATTDLLFAQVPRFQT